MQTSYFKYVTRNLCDALRWLAGCWPFCVADRCRFHGWGATTRTYTCWRWECRRTARIHAFRSTSSIPTIGDCKSSTRVRVTKASTSARYPSTHLASTPSASSSLVSHDLYILGLVARQWKFNGKPQAVCAVAIHLCVISWSFKNRTPAKRWVADRQLADNAPDESICHYRLWQTLIGYQ